MHAINQAIPSHGQQRKVEQCGQPTCLNLPLALHVAKHVLPSNTIACGTSTVLLRHKSRDKFAQDHKVFAALVLLGTQIGDPKEKPSCESFTCKAISRASAKQ